MVGDCGRIREGFEDPVLLQSLGIRHAALIKEEEANKRELDQLQYEIDKMKE
jgi:hypothetical protein